MACSARSLGSSKSAAPLPAPLGYVPAIGLVEARRPRRLTSRSGGLETTTNPGNETIPPNGNGFLLLKAP